MIGSKLELDKSAWRWEGWKKKRTINWMLPKKKKSCGHWSVLASREITSKFSFNAWPPFCGWEINDSDLEQNKSIGLKWMAKHSHSSWMEFLRSVKGEKRKTCLLCNGIQTIIISTTNWHEVNSIVSATLQTRHIVTQISILRGLKRNRVIIYKLCTQFLLANKRKEPKWAS